VAPQSTTAERVEQYAIHINQAEKQALLTISLRKGLASNEIDRALVFTRTKHGADRVVRHLHAAGVTAAAIHGNKSQAQRTAALGAFRKGDCPVLVATDIAARGIDVSGVSHVFNFELPNVPEQYVHRIGRTARAGADGVSISFVAPDEKPYLRDIERLTRVQLTALPLPANFLEEAARLPAPSRKPAELAQDARHEARDERGRGGPRRESQGRGGHRGGQNRDGGQRNDHNRRPQGERGPVFNPAGNEGRGSIEHRAARAEGDRRPAPQGDRHKPHQLERRARPEGDGGQRSFRRRGGGQGGFRGKANNAG
jgi:ATP-dependent RNA helicase RhlE